VTKVLLEIRLNLTVARNLSARIDLGHSRIYHESRFDIDMPRSLKLPETASGVVMPALPAREGVRRGCGTFGLL